MSTQRLTKDLFWAAESALLLAALAVAAMISHRFEWQPISLVVFLLGLTVGGSRVEVRIGGGMVSGSYIALTLIMALLGPVPAVVAGLAGITLNSALRKLPPADWLTNLSTYAVFPLVGGILIRELAGNVHGPGGVALSRSLTFALIVFAVAFLCLVINFSFVALDLRVHEHHSLRRLVREMFVPLLPGHLATVALAVVLTIAYASAGLEALLAAVVVMMIFQYLTVALVRSEDRAEKLEARSIHLAKLQLGVLAMLMEALALRDPSTSRHATAVARYARALAIEAGFNEEEQEIVHTAALLHDIGKFTWPDRALNPSALTDADWEMIRRHPQDGAALVGKLDGYGSVADAILYHHERVDGSGYPAGLIGREIPAASRIVAICSTYDTMITRNIENGAPMASSEAVAELRALGGGQLDGELVDLFIKVLEREGPALQESGDFEAELALDSRVRRMAQPQGR